MRKNEIILRQIINRGGDATIKLSVYRTETLQDKTNYRYYGFKHTMGRIER